MKFLWAVVHHPEPSVKRVLTVTCNIPSTCAWLEKIHNEKLLSRLPNFSSPTQTLQAGPSFVPQTPKDKNLVPTETMRFLLEQNSSIQVQAQLQHEFATRDHMCALSSAMFTAIKQGMLASQPTHTDINGLSPFFTPNKSKENCLDQASLQYLKNFLLLIQLHDHQEE